MPLNVKLTAYEEGRLVEWGIRSPVATLVHRFEFEPLDAGHCRVRHMEFAEGLLAILTRPMLGKIEQFDRQLANDFQAAFRKNG
jgi:hypothetical protein